jgi:hypothetical protein
MMQRLLIAALVLALVQGGVLLIRQKRQPIRIAEPAMPLTDLPERLGGWRGSEFVMDARLSAAIGAHSILDRVYRDSTGAQLQLELAAFLTRDNELLHLPQSC